MKIAQVAPLYEAVPPRAYGGTERVVAALCNQLCKAGHDVTLFASGESVTAAHLAAIVRRLTPEERADWAVEIARQAGIPLRVAAKVDPIDFAYWDSYIKPLFEANDVEFVGAITEAQKPAFFAGAAATLFPVDWPEP